MKSHKNFEDKIEIVRSLMLLILVLDKLDVYFKYMSLSDMLKFYEKINEKTS